MLNSTVWLYVPLHPYYTCKKVKLVLKYAKQKVSLGLSLCSFYVRDLSFNNVFLRYYIGRTEHKKNNFIQFCDLSHMTQWLAESIWHEGGGGARAGLTYGEGKVKATPRNANITKHVFCITLCCDASQCLKAVRLASLIASCAASRCVVSPCRLHIRTAFVVKVNSPNFFFLIIIRWKGVKYKPFFLNLFLNSTYW